ncbi:ATP-binding protein [Vibrio sp. S4M6]|uniref:sensor histidine kinase n=1 Tax=Vibrio sinus TaxID=2946865 RepID=UPI00202A48D6|nr:ATP-binding protein [Vibrio sinus]MCL9783794.1 ATP-binding protein [Vibrio sinus]
MNKDNVQPDPLSEARKKHTASSLASTSLIRRYHAILYGGLVLILLLTLGNAFYLGQQTEKRIINEEKHHALQTLITLNNAISVSLNHVDKMKQALEAHRSYPEKAYNYALTQYLFLQSPEAPTFAPWNNLSDSLKHQVGQLYVHSNSGDIRTGVSVLLSMMPEVVTTHRLHKDFQWSYYYDANKRYSLLYPGLPYQVLFDATASTDMDSTLDVVYDAGGTLPVKLVGPESNPNKEHRWTRPYLDAGGKGMMVSLLEPIYHQDAYIGAVGTDITLKVLDSILSKRQLAIGHLAIVAKSGLVIGDSKGALTKAKEVVNHEQVLSLSAPGAAHQVASGERQSAHDGYWYAYPLTGTPWSLVLEISHTEMMWYILSSLLPYLITGFAFAAILFFIVLHQHWRFSQPALKLAHFVEDLPQKSNIQIPNVPQKWRYWFDCVKDTELERREHLQTINKQTENLENLVQERTQELEATLTTLKQTQEKLVRSEKLAGLGSLVSGISHELNTPVGNAITISSSIKDTIYEFKHIQDESKAEDYFQRIEESAEFLEKNLKRSVELINNFKQISVDQANFHKAKFDLPELLTELKLNVSSLLSKEQISLSEHYPKSLQMHSYPDAISKVMDRLINNVIRHAFAESAQKSLTIECLLIEQSKVRIDVTDNGKGIDTEKVSKVFDPFYTTQLGQGSSGLGLHIVYNLVTELLKGDITVESEQDKGTTFRITLPLQIDAI